MRKSSKLIVGLAAAAITFGSLFAFVGTDHWDKYRHHHHSYYDHGCQKTMDEHSKE